MPRLQQFLFVPVEGDAKLPSGSQLVALQQFLNAFGFLHLAGTPPVMGANPTGDLPKSTLGTADQGTVEALKHFQLFFGLDDTGKLDVATAAKLNLPRCANPDRHEEGEPSSRVRVGVNPWGKVDLTYSFINFSKKLTQSKVQDAFKSAFRLWSASSALTFKKTSDGGDITIQFFPPDEPGYTFDGPFGTLAITYFPQDGRAQFDDDEEWTALDSPPPGTGSGIDLVSVAAHEIGHALGLDHSNDPASLMFPMYDGPHRFLSANDRSRIQSLYGTKDDDDTVG
jgi:hypothetical protein